MMSPTKEYSMIRSIDGWMDELTIDTWKSEGIGYPREHRSIPIQLGSEFLPQEDAGHVEVRESPSQIDSKHCQQTQANSTNGYYNIDGWIVRLGLVEGGLSS